MKKILTLAVFLFYSLLFAQSQHIKYIDPFIGTDGTGHTFPGPSMPFGMVQPGPDNNDSDWAYTCGYQYKDTTILGFSQTRLSGTGINELGDVLLLPYSAKSVDRYGIDKKSEEAKVGYYSITKKDSVKVELTCTNRVALHRYTYPASEANLFLDLQHGLKFMTDSLVLDSDVKIENNRTISGYCRTKNWVERSYAFVLTFDHPFSAIKKQQRGAKDGADSFDLTFKLGTNKQLMVKVALSTTDTEGAKRNLTSEMKDWDFERVQESNQREWSKYIDRVDIKADSEKTIVFYTSLYHLLLQPSNIADVDGRYRGADNKIAKATNGQYYSTLSNWDVYRAAFPLLQIIVPEIVDGIVNSMLEHHKVSGILPVWTVWGQENYCMIGNHAIPMILSAYQNGFQGFDAKYALEAMIGTSQKSHTNSDWVLYNKYGYYPFDLVHDESVSKLLENGYDDWCVASFADLLDDTRAGEFKKRALYYNNIFCPENKLFRGRSVTGEWRTPFNPVMATSPLNNPGDYTEANAWQYFWTPAQHDIDGITKLLGGKAAFTDHLNKFFTADVENPDKFLGQEAMIGQYAHGNEPCHHIVYLYKYSDEPQKLDYYINKIVNEFYKPTPDGMLGNDDCGQMSAWYVLSSLGFYPVNPANGEFVIGAPQIEEATIKLANGNTFRMVAHGLSDKNISVSSVSLCGKEITNGIYFTDIVKGGTLEFRMKPYRADMKNEYYTQLPFGAIRPMGWLKELIQKDMDGMIGNLDKLVPELMNDPVYGSERLGRDSKVKDLGNSKEGDAEGDEQYKWWNSETQSNWRDGYVRAALLLNDPKHLSKVKHYIDQIVSTQDADGYLGIYTPDTRYNFDKENGELWAKTTLYRVLLGYYEATGDERVFNALVKAVANVMQNWVINESHPFLTGTNFNGGATHGLTFTDVLDRMYQITGDRKYRDYALFLYLDFSANYASEQDVQLKNVLDDSYRLNCHGVHTYEHIRPLIVAAYTSASDTLSNALDKLMDKIEKVVTKTGGAIGDEWIYGRVAHADSTGYEYCSLQELLDSYALLLQKSGDAAFAGKIENLYYNAALGARDPKGRGIAYLKTDNSYEMLGCRNGEVEHDRVQTRYKYSPVHQDVAVCCVPNAGRISPYFISKSWLIDSGGSLCFNLLQPNVVKTVIDGNAIKIEAQTNYPNDGEINLNIETQKAITIKIRRPDWCKEVTSNFEYEQQGDFLVFAVTDRSCTIKLNFLTEIRVEQDFQGKHYFAYGAQYYALPIKAEEIPGRSYAKGFNDYTYKPLSDCRYEYTGGHNAVYKGSKIEITLHNKTKKCNERVTLLPISKTILRQIAF